MKTYDLLSPSPKSSSDDLCEEGEVLLKGSEKPIRTRTRTNKFNLGILYSVIVILTLALIFAPRWRADKCQDPSLGIYCKFLASINYYSWLTLVLQLLPKTLCHTSSSSSTGILKTEARTRKLLQNSWRRCGKTYITVCCSFPFHMQITRLI